MSSSSSSSSSRGGDRRSSLAVLAREGTNTSNTSIARFYSPQYARNQYTKDPDVLSAKATLLHKRKATSALQVDLDSKNSQLRQLVKRRRVAERQVDLANRGKDDQIKVDADRELSKVTGCSYALDDEIQAAEDILKQKMSEEEEAGKQLEVALETSKRKYDAIAVQKQEDFKKQKVDLKSTLQKAASKKHDVRVRKIARELAKKSKREQADAMHAKQLKENQEYEERRYITTKEGLVEVDCITDHGDGFSFSGKLKDSGEAFDSGYVFSSLRGAKKLKKSKSERPRMSLKPRLAFIIEKEYSPTELENDNEDTNEAGEEESAAAWHARIIGRNGGRDDDDDEERLMNGNNNNNNNGRDNDDDEERLMNGNNNNNNNNNNPTNLQNDIPVIPDNETKLLMKELTDVHVFPWGNDTLSSTGTDTLSSTGIERAKGGMLVWKYNMEGSIFVHQGVQGETIVPGSSARERAPRSLDASYVRKDGTSTQHREIASIKDWEKKKMYYLKKRSRQTAQLVITKLKESDKYHEQAMDLIAMPTRDWKEVDGVDYGQVYDTVCNKTLEQNVSVIKKHFDKKKHNCNKQKKAITKRNGERLLATREIRLKATNGQGKGRTLRPADVLLRTRTTAAALKSLTGLKAINILRDVIEDVAEGPTIGDAKDLGDCIKDLHKDTLNTLTQEMEDFYKQLVIVIDATTLATDEKTAILTRMLDKNYYIQQRLVAIVPTDGHVGGKAQANLIKATAKRIGIKIEQLIALCADRAGANAVTAETLGGEEKDIDELIMNEFPQLHIFLVGCFSHTFDKVGQKFDAPELKEFMQAVRGLLGLSNEAKALFRAQDANGKNLAGYAAIRWWNDWVQQVQIMSMGIDKIKEMASTLQLNHLCKASAKKIIDLCNNPVKLARLHVQMAASIERGKPFCKLGFDLEGDGPLAFVTGTRIDVACAAIAPDVATPMIDAAALVASGLVAPLVVPMQQKEEEHENAVTQVKNELDRIQRSIKRVSVRGNNEKPILEEGDKVYGKRMRNNNRQEKATVTKTILISHNSTYVYKIKYDGNEEIEEENEVEVRKQTAQSPRETKKAERVLNLNQQKRLDKLHEHKRNLAFKEEELKTKEEILSTTQQALANFGPITFAQWRVYADQVTKPGLDYIRTRFIEVDTVATSYGCKAINYGLKATRAFHAAGALNTVKGASLDLSEFKRHINQCKEFTFLTTREIDAALHEAEAVWHHMCRHKILPPVVLKDEKIMQKGSVKKKVEAMKRIKLRRRAFVEAEANGELDGGAGLAALAPNDAPPDDLFLHPEIPDILKDKKRFQLVKELMKDQKGVNMEAYSVMEWWRMPTSSSVGARPRLEAFPAIGNLVKKIALCLPSSAPAERVFSILKLVLSKKDFAKIVDNYELACWLICNDLDI